MKRRNPMAKSLQQKQYQPKIVPKKRKDREWSTDFEEICYECDGSGFDAIEDDVGTCPICDGEGMIPVWRMR